MTSPFIEREGGHPPYERTEEPRGCSIADITGTESSSLEDELVEYLSIVWVVARANTSLVCTLN